MTWVTELEDDVVLNWIERKRASSVLFLSSQLGGQPRFLAF